MGEGEGVMEVRQRMFLVILIEKKIFLISLEHAKTVGLVEEGCNNFKAVNESKN